jgi:hypothetical protein
MSNTDNNSSEKNNNNISATFRVETFPPIPEIVDSVYTKTHEHTDTTWIK